MAKRRGVRYELIAIAKSLKNQRLLYDGGCTGFEQQMDVIGKQCPGIAGGGCLFGNSKGGRSCRNCITIQILRGTPLKN